MTNNYKLRTRALAEKPAMTEGFDSIGHDIDAPNEFGMPPLHVAFAAGQVEEARKILARGASPHNATEQNGWSLSLPHWIDLHIVGGRPEIATQLAKLVTAHFNEPLLPINPQQSRERFEAFLKRSERVITSLKATSGREASITGYEVSDYRDAAGNNLTYNFHLVGKALNTPNTHGNPPLITAFFAGQVAEAEALIERGADPAKAVTKDGQTLADMITYNRNIGRRDTADQLAKVLSKTAESAPAARADGYSPGVKQAVNPPRQG